MFILYRGEKTYIYTSFVEAIIFHLVLILLYESPILGVKYFIP